MDTVPYAPQRDNALERRAKEILDCMRHAEDGRITIPPENRWWVDEKLHREYALTITACNLLVARSLAVRVAGFFPHMFRLC